MEPVRDRRSRRQRIRQHDKMKDEKKGLVERDAFGTIVEEASNAFFYYLTLPSSSFSYEIQTEERVQGPCSVFPFIGGKKS